MWIGDDPIFFRRAHAGLICVLALAALWSTAMTEMTSVLLLILFVAALWFRVKAFRPGEGFPRLVMLTCLIVLGIHVTAVLISISGTPLAPYAGRLWRPLLLVVTVFTPMEDKDLVLAGACLFVSGACAAGTALVINLVQRVSTPLTAFTGLTTFADLLVLTAVVGISFIVGWKERKRERLWMWGMEFLVVLALFWTAERAPVAVLAVAGGILLVSLRPRLLPAWGLLLGGFLLLGPLALRDKFDWLFHLQPLDRYIVWEEGFRLVAHVPVFGYGPGSYSHIMPADAWGRFNNRPPSSWHNDLLQVTLDSGPIAALALAAVLIVVVYCAVKALSYRVPGHGHPAKSCPGLLLIILAILGTVGSVVTTALLGDAFWIIAGLTVQAGCRAMRPHMSQAGS